MNDTIPENIQKIAAQIGEFYLQKNCGDFRATQTEILRTKFAAIEETETGITIWTSRPGILIGKRGENIDKLSAHLGKQIHIEEVRQSLEDFLVPYDPGDF